MRFTFALAATVAIAAGCSTAPNPLYCTLDQPGNGCPPDRPRCDVAHRACVAGAVDGGARDGSVDGGCACLNPAAPICDGASCRACMTESDCAARSSATPHCAAGMCVQCNASPDCAGEAPVCDQHACRPCARHDECASRVCLDDGSCATAVLYVDNRGNASCAGGSGTLADPWCQIADAFAAAHAAPGKPLVVHVAASAAPYAPLAASDGSVALYADPPWQIGAASAAMIRPAMQVAALVALSGTAVASFDGFDIGGNTPVDAVSCLASVPGPQLTLRRTWVHDQGGVAVSASRCAVTLERDVIGPSRGSGLRFVDGPYAVQGTFIVGHMSVGVTTVGDATGILRWNSIAQNGSVATGPGALSCGGNGGTTIEHSIVWSSSRDQVSNAAWSGNCTFTDSDLEVPTGGNDSIAPTFVGGPMGWDLHLAPAPGNVQCCVDKLAPKDAPANALARDIDGARRPKGAGWDRGAHELK